MRAAKWLRGCVLALLCLGALPAAAGPIQHDADYPMAAAKFRQHLAVKATRYRERLDEQMKEHGVPEKKQLAARKSLGAIVVKIDRAADKACADGTVTLAEANELRALSKGLRDDLYHELGLSRSKGE